MEAKEEKRWTGVIAFAVILAAWLVLAVSSSAQMVQPQVAAGGSHTVGLKSDGTVVAVGDNSFGQLNVGSWTNIVQVAAGESHTVGLKADGTVVAVGAILDQIVRSWSNIVAIGAGNTSAMGVKSDGTVVGTGAYISESWTNIVQVAGGGMGHTVALKSDGTVEAQGLCGIGECDVWRWNNIVQVAAGGSSSTSVMIAHAVGLKKDGTVVAVGTGSGLDVGSWTNIVQVAAWKSHTVGLKSDGTVVATGDNPFGELDVGSWTDIVQVAIGGSHTVGLKSDGTVVSAGDNSSGQGNVSGWNLLAEFGDVPPEYWAHNYIMAIYGAQITAGCSTDPLEYCPEASVTREQMAVFLIRALDQVPADGYCGAMNAFSDVTFDRWSCKYLKRLAELGITTGYGDGRFGPEDSVTREQMAVFITKALASVPPDGYCGTADPFTDVSFDRWSCKYVKEMAELGITTGYGDGRFGPDDYVTRAQMAVFLSRAFLGM